jgi:hypothetical protein
MRRLMVAVLLFISIDSLLAATGGRRRAVRSPGGPVEPPVAAADAYTLQTASTLIVPAPGVLVNDTLNRASLVSFGPSVGTEHTAFGSSAPTAQGGSLTLAADGRFTYTAAAGFSGTDAFRYTVRNGGGTSQATVTITVAAASQVSAVADSYTTPPENPLFVPAPGVLTNDTLAGGSIVGFGPRNGTEQTILGATSATSSGGVISLGPDGSFLYNPPPTTDDGYGNSRPFLGLDTFSYTIQSGPLSSMAVVNVAVEVPLGEADFVITTPGHYYAISSLTGENPVLRLERGRSYLFQISASPAHPFAILDAPPGNVVNNNITSGTLTFTVPPDARNYRYRCTTHGFGNVTETEP